MARMQAVYYRDSRGREPVSDFIDDGWPLAFWGGLGAVTDELSGGGSSICAVARFA